MVDSAEIQGVIVPNDGGDLSYGVIGSFQQVLCVVHADVEEVLLGRNTVHFLEVAHEQTDAGVTGLGVFFDIDGLVVMLVEILTGKVHLLLNRCGNKRGLFKTGTLDHQEKLS